MGGSIFVINPNSSEVVTAAIRRAVEGLAVPGGPEITCLRLEAGPPAIESQRDVDGVVEPLCRLVNRIEGGASAIVIGCFSDPAIHSIREQTRVPVLGIMESGVVTALTLAQRFGILAIQPTSIPRHLRYLGAMGVLGRLAADRALGLGVAELADEERAIDRMIEVGTTLRDVDGAGVVIMGCAGMADYRARLAEALHIPVVEPVQAATAMAIGRVQLGW